MNIQKSGVIEDSKNETITFSKLSNQPSTINTRSSTRGLKQFVAERPQGSNKLLFGITVTVLTMIMGGSIFCAVNQYQQSNFSNPVIINK